MGETESQLTTKTMLEVNQPSENSMGIAPLEMVKKVVGDVSGWAINA